ARLVWTISGAAFAGTAASEHASSFGVDVLQSVAAVGAGAGLVLTGLSVLGALGLVRRGDGTLAVALVAIPVLAVVIRAWFGFDPETPDHHAYLLPGVIALVVLAAAGAAVIASAVASMSRAAPPGIRRGAPVIVALVLAGLA